jgi:hypothetical protein
MLDLYNDPNGATYNMFVPVTTIHGISSGVVLQNRLRDGLKYIKDRFNEIPVEMAGLLKYTRTDYEILHAILIAAVRYNPAGVSLTLRLTRSSGIVVRELKETTSEGVSKNSVVVTSQVFSIRDEVVKFLESTFDESGEGNVKQFKDLHLTEADKVWLKNLLATTPGLIPCWQNNNLTIVKEL